MTTRQKIDALLESFDERRGKIDLTLGRISAFLELIGNPHLKIPPVIHFAGTNGKGSTIAFLKAIIEAEGRSCHVYTSPHLVKFNERIKLNGQDISDEKLLAILEQLNEIYRRQDKIKLTFFELTTIVAFIAFASIQADYTLLETGLGGRFDATNLFARPLLTVITPISFDHTEYLGNTLARIAYEKAGIIKQNITCVSAPQLPEAETVLREVAVEKNAELVFVSPKTPLKLSLKGEHQQINAANAKRAAEFLGLGAKAITRGLTTAIWPARLQQLQRGGLVGLLGIGSELWLDGAHNQAGAQALAAEIEKTKQPVFLVIGMLNNKDAKSYFAAIKGLVSGIYTIPIPGHDTGFSAADLAKIAGPNAIPMPDAAAAIKDIAEKHPAPARIFICGSLYLAGHILKSNS